MNKKEDDKTARLFVAAVLGTLVILSMLAFLTILPPKGEFLLRTLSIIFMCFVIYRAGLTRAIFGTESQHLDLVIIGTCVFLSLMPVINFLVAPGEGGIVAIVLSALVNSLDYTTIYAIGTGLLLILAVVLALHLPVKSPSVMSMLGEKDHPKHPDGFAIRTLLSFVILVAFYIVMFDITLQWWGVITDTASILFIVTGLGIAMMRGSTSHISFSKFLLYLEGLDNKYYNKLIGLFHAPTTVLFGIAGLLVFYPLSDLGVFLVPYVTNIPNAIFQALSPQTHIPLSVLAYDVFAQNGITSGTFATLAYVLCAIAAIMALFLPAFFWYRAFMKRTLTLSPLISSLFIAGVTCFLIAPAFGMQALSSTNAQLVGVDITSNSLVNSPVIAAVLLAIVTGTITWLLARRFPHLFSLIIILAVIIFLGRYMTLYFGDVWSDLLSNALTFLHTATVNSFLSGFLFLCFLAISAIFYAGAIVVYCYEIGMSVWVEHHKEVKKWKRPSNRHLLTVKGNR
jgi:hypothetical protein